MEITAHEINEAKLRTSYTKSQQQKKKEEGRRRRQ
jgi:hypothetical protein